MQEKFFIIQMLQRMAPGYEAAVLSMIILSLPAGVVQDLIELPNSDKPLLLALLNHIKEKDIDLNNEEKVIKCPKLKLCRQVVKIEFKILDDAFN